MSTCKAEIYVRDTYRYSGRGHSGFSLHYKRRQCSRTAIHPNGYCWQHQYLALDCCTQACCSDGSCTAEIACNN